MFYKIVLLHFFSFFQGMQTRERAHFARSVFPFIKKSSTNTEAQLTVFVDAEEQFKDNSEESSAAALANTEQQPTKAPKKISKNKYHADRGSNKFPASTFLSRRYSLENSQWNCGPFAKETTN